MGLMWLHFRDWMEKDDGIGASLDVSDSSLYLPRVVMPDLSLLTPPNYPELPLHCHSFFPENKIGYYVVIV